MLYCGCFETIIKYCNKVRSPFNKIESNKKYNFVLEKHTFPKFCRIAKPNLQLKFSQELNFDSMKYRIDHYKRKKNCLKGMCAVWICYGRKLPEVDSHTNAHVSYSCFNLFLMHSWIYKDHYACAVIGNNPKPESRISSSISSL